MYFLGAQNNIHPTYIQNLLSNAHYGPTEVIGALRYLSELENSSSFSGQVFETALSFTSSVKPLSGENKATGLLNGQEILIADSPNSEKHRKGIERYIERKSLRL